MSIVDTLKYIHPPYQKQAECLDFMYGKEFFAVLMDPGTGKTYITIVEAANLWIEGKIDFAFIVAPSGIDIQWATEQLPQHCPVPFSAFIWDGLNTEKEKKRFRGFYNEPNVALKFLFVKIDAFSRGTYIKLFKNILKGKQAYLAIDEASTIKNPEAERTFNLMYNINSALALDNSEVDLSLAKLKGNRGLYTKVESFVSSAKYRRILTGSLITTSPYNAWAPFQVLKYNFFECSYEGFRNRHGIETREKGFHDKEYHRALRKDEMERVLKLHVMNWTNEDISVEMKISETSVQYIIDNPENRSPYKNLERLKLDISLHSFTCSLSDVRDLDLVEETRTVEMSAEQKRLYREVSEDMIAKYEDKELTVVHKLALMVKLSQITSGFFPADNFTVNEDGDIINKEVELIPIGTKNPKIEATIAEIEEHNFDSPLLIFARFTVDIKLLKKELSKTYPELRIYTYYGEDTEDERNTIKKLFMEGFVDVLIANPSMAGVGLNLQRANVELWYSFNYSFERRKQGIGRIMRSDQKENTVLVKSLVCVKTIDTRVLEILTQRKELADYFADNISIREFIQGV